MRRLAILLCLALLARAVPVAAQTEIHRCVGAKGGAVFTDQPCAALQATPVSPDARPDPVAAPLAAPPPILCAASAGELRQSVIDAFASRDANRMAGLMLWNGYGRGAAIADIRALADLMKHPLLDVNLPDDSAPAQTASINDPFATNVPPAPPPAGGQLVLQVADNDGSGTPRELHFDIVHQAGCLWLRDVN